jgi:hypothetical protein
MRKTDQLEKKAVLAFAGLPDGIFSNQKFQFEYILEGLEVEHVGLFYGHLEYIKAVWYIVCPYGNLGAVWFIWFSPVLVNCLKKNLATLGVYLCTIRPNCFSQQKTANNYSSLNQRPCG